MCKHLHDVGSGSFSTGTKPARRKRPESLDAYDLVLRAMPFANTHIAEDTPMAIPLLEKAPQFDPGYAAAHGLMAWCYHFRYSRGGLREADRQSAPQQRKADIAGLPRRGPQANMARIHATDP